MGKILVVGLAAFLGVIAVRLAIDLFGPAGAALCVGVLCGLLVAARAARK